MSGSKHTKSPWEIVDDNGVFCRIRSVKERRLIATVPCGNTLANARLIAAAPDTAAERDRLKAVNADLLAALRLTAEQALRSEIPEGYGPEFRSKEWEAGYDAAISAARAAIAKAERGAE